MAYFPMKTPVFSLVVEWSLYVVHVFDFFDIVFYRFFVFSTFYHVQDCRVLRRQHHISRSVDGIYPCGKYGQSLVSVLDLKINFGAYGFSDPVALHDFDFVRPALQLIQIVQEPFGVIGYLQIPLGKVFLSNRSLTPFAAAVNDLLVGQYGLAARTPVYRIFFFVGQSSLIKLYEYPLHPFIVIRMTCGYFPVPIV